MENSRLTQFYKNIRLWACALKGWVAISVISARESFCKNLKFNLFFGASGYSMMIKQKGFVPIDKLGRIANYNNWSWDIPSYLRNQGLWSTIVASADGKVCEDAKLKEKAPTTIDMCVTPSVGAHILYIHNSQKAWEKLQQIYESDGAARRINLLWNLIRTKLSQKYGWLCNQEDHMGWKIERYWIRSAWRMACIAAFSGYT